MKPSLLIVKADPTVHGDLEKILHSFELTFAQHWQEALDALNGSSFSLVVLQIPEDPGLLINQIQKIQTISRDTYILVTGLLDSWKDAISSLQIGAYDYLPQPFYPHDVLNTVQRACQRQQQKLPGSAWELIGTSPQLSELFLTIKRVAPTQSTILIQGESGTGKELIARAIHDNSDRHNKSFVSVNCGAFTATLLESELFGHMKGSFTGADRTKKGLVEVAEGGTFFLDEVSEMPLDLQVKLLRLLEEKEFIPVGANKAMKIDVRFVCATNRQLQQEVKAGTFREDLFYRLNVIPLNLPPLRERGDDVITIAEYFIKHYGKQMNSTVTRLSTEVQEIFKHYPWPGNVRELENTIQRALALGEPGSMEIVLDDIEERIHQSSATAKTENKGVAQHSPIDLTIPQEGLDLAAHLEDLEKVYILKALEITDGNKTKAAQLLNMKLRSFSYKIDKYNI